MPRRLISKQLADFFAVLANADRIRIIEELQDGEIDVHGLQELLGIPQARVSQQLAVLRAHRLVAERRAGRHVYYHLQQPSLAAWILHGLEFFDGNPDVARQIRDAVEEVRTIWTVPEHTPENTPG